LIVITLKVSHKKHIVREEKKENNMRRYSKEIIDKIELIKEIIISRSILRNIRNDIKWELEISSDGGENIYEIVLYVTVNNQDCNECDFEPVRILEEIHRYQKSIYNSINKLSFDKKLNIVKYELSTLRGILVSKVSYELETITIEYGIFIDTI
jgi:hypothetical protein